MQYLSCTHIYCALCSNLCCLVRIFVIEKLEQIEQKFGLAETEVTSLKNALEESNRKFKMQEETREFHEQRYLVRKFLITTYAMFCYAGTPKPVGLGGGGAGNQALFCRYVFYRTTRRAIDLCLLLLFHLAITKLWQDLFFLSTSKEHQHY